MKLHFLGTGGGRFCMIRQLRQTGGFVVEADDLLLDVDPAPGALVRALDSNVQLEGLDGVFVSHAHLDHCGDLEVMVEAMTEGCTEERGALIANGTTLHGSGDIDPGIDTYHREAVADVVEAEEGGSHDLAGASLTFHETEHKDVQTTGFLLETDDRTLGYVPDTELFDGLAEKFADADVLVCNVLRPHDNDWQGHLNLEDAVKLVESVDPDRALFQHFGMNFLTSFRDQLDWLDENTDREITLASDNATYTIGEESGGLEKFV